MSTNKTKHHSIDNMEPSSFEGSISYISGIPGDRSASHNNVSHLGNNDAAMPSLSKSEESACIDSATPSQLHKPDSDELTVLREELMLLIGELEEILIED